MPAGPTTPVAVPPGTVVGTVQPDALTGKAGALTADQRGQVTSYVWAAALLLQLVDDGALSVSNINGTNIANITRWMTAEGGSGPAGLSAPGQTWLYNNDPLNASLNTTGQFRYNTVNDGVVNTAKMIEQSNMASILGALKMNANTDQFSVALVNSQWNASVPGGPSYVADTAAHGPYFLNAYGELNAWATGSGGNPTGALGQIPTTVGGALQGLATDTPIGGAVGAVTSLGSEAQAVTTLISDVLSPTYWRKWGLTIGGALLIALGVVIILSDTDEGKQIRSEAGTAAVAAAA